jgi:hypothetical protein
MRLMQPMDDQPMDDRGSVSIVVSLDLAAQPVGGWIHDGSDTAREFTGWLELMSAIRRLQAQATEREES